jgi:hypothetical protein
MPAPIDFPAGVSGRNGRPRAAGRFCSTGRVERPFHQIQNLQPSLSFTLIGWVNESEDDAAFTSLQIEEK